MGCGSSAEKKEEKPAPEAKAEEPKADTAPEAKAEEPKADTACEAKAEEPKADTACEAKAEELKADAAPAPAAAATGGPPPPPPPPPLFTLQNIENQAVMFWAILDKDKSGTLSFNEIQEWIDNGDPLAQISVFKGMSGDQVMAALDKDGDASTTRQEFIDGVRAAFNKGKTALPPPPPPPGFTLNNLENQTNMFWAMLDKDKSGSLSFEEIAKWINEADATLQIAAFKGHTGEEIMQQIDTSGDGVVTKEEFIVGLTKAFNGNFFKSVSSTPPPPPPPPFFTAANLENQTHMFWARLDSDGNGTLDTQEVVQLADGADPMEQIPAFKGISGEELLKLLDKNSDGKITKDEFLTAVKNALEAKKIPPPPPPPLFAANNIASETDMFWALMDTDKSGELSSEEVCKWIDGDKLLVPSVFHGMTGAAVFELLDTVADGKITKEEFQTNVEKAFKQYTY